MSSQKEFEAQLTLKDRLNYPYYIGDAILTRNRTIVAIEQYSQQQTVEATKNLRGLIPSSWEDEEFKKDVKEAKVKSREDIRPLVAGNIRLSVQMCEKLGIPTVKEEETFDDEKLQRACINLLDRRGLTARRSFTEKMTGRPTRGVDIATSEAEEL